MDLFARDWNGSQAFTGVDLRIGRAFVGAIGGGRARRTLRSPICRLSFSRRKLASETAGQRQRLDCMSSQQRTLLWQSH